MKKHKKIFLLILTFIPITVVLAWFLYVPWFMHQPSERQSIFFNVMFEYFFYVVPPFQLLALGLMIFYIHNALNNKALADSKRTAWVLLMIFGNALAWPIYFFTYLWKDKKN